MKRSLWDREHLFSAFASLTIHASALLAVLGAAYAIVPGVRQQDPLGLNVSWVTLSTGERGHAHRPAITAGDEPLSMKETPVKTPERGGDPEIKTSAPAVTAQTESRSTGPAVVTGHQAVAQRGQALSALSVSHGENISPESSGNAAVQTGVSGKETLAVPRYRENAEPSYPRLARMKGYEGIVLLSAEVYADGRVSSLKIKKSSGYPILDRSAYDAVATWIFEPGRRMGKPVSMWVDVPVKFVLRD